MKKMVISLVIEGNEEDLHTIKGNIIKTACEALVSVTANEIEEPKKELQIPTFMFKECCDREQIKRCLNKMYGRQIMKEGV